MKIVHRTLPAPARPTIYAVARYVVIGGEGCWQCLTYVSEPGDGGAACADALATERGTPGAVVYELPGEEEEAR